MKCTVCSQDQFSTLLEDFPLPGLPNVTLVETKKKTCSHCGEYRRYIPRHQALTEKVTIALLNKRNLLAPAEIRWLRSHLGVTSAQLAMLLKVSPTTISYWENGKRKPSHAADLLLRLLVSTTLPPGSFSFQTGLQVQEQDHAPLSLKLRFDGSNWVLWGDPGSELLVADLAEPGWGNWSVSDWLKDLQGSSLDEFLQE